jgi:membrane protein YdbS with pleckstrin-like domain
MSTDSKKNDNSLRHFSPDLLTALALPIVIPMLVASWLFSLHGTPWLWAAAISFGIAIIGAALLFIAKLPLYRQRRFFTFGIQAIPQSSHGFYLWGCRLAIVGCVLMFFLWLGSFSWR